MFQESKDTSKLRRTRALSLELGQKSLEPGEPRARRAREYQNARQLHDFTPGELDSTSLQTLWEWKNSVSKTATDRVPGLNLKKKAADLLPAGTRRRCGAIGYVLETRGQKALTGAREPHLSPLSYSPY